ncbi:hypothetical protein [Wolbachia endosymbiont of Diaphorina citri]|jgi:hypothetical protein|uniref:hypothetical protein n=1 Tax=Wolbachia endosymbiont of Diaphorina citri TaxID=116598 RepID=UPI001F285B5E|nr:hypothetical protein [Wolbachia endosymbiont of Diaphorina citri]
MKDDTKDMLISLGTVATIGALTGLGLSFTALSPLVMGGIVGSIAPALITALLAGHILYQFTKKILLKKMIKITLFLGVLLHLQVLQLELVLLQLQLLFSLVQCLEWDRQL